MSVTERRFETIRDQPNPCCVRWKIVHHDPGTAALSRS
jgi:hypothetical protein